MEDFFEKIKLLSNSLEKYKNNKNILLSLQLSNFQKNDMNTIINKLNLINDKISDISNDIDELQYNIDNNELNKNNEINERIKQYEINKKICDAFTPYMLLCNLLLNNIDN